jgi:hypothetical protein
MLRFYFTILLSLCLAACGAPTVIDDSMTHVAGPLPADFSGSWQRNYARDDNVDAVLRRTYDRLRRATPDQGFRGGPASPGPSAKDVNSLMALARLADEITKSDLLQISQDDYEIRVDREDDFSLTCGFFNGAAKGTGSSYGNEICGWDGKQLVSLIELPDGLNIVHRFTISADGEQLRVVTTLTSSTSRTPFTLRRFYRKYDRPAREFNCIETLSMKRVCSTKEITP